MLSERPSLMINVNIKAFMSENVFRVCQCVIDMVNLFSDKDVCTHW